MNEEPYYVVRKGSNDRRLTTDRKSPIVYDTKEIADDTIRGGEYVSISVAEYNQKYGHYMDKDMRSALDTEA